MTESSVDGPDDDQFDEVREAAGAVLASLKWLVEATERVIDDPGAFAQAVDNGRSVVGSFLAGFAEHIPGAGAEGADGGEEPVPES